MNAYTYRVVAGGCEQWESLPGHDRASIAARAAHTLELIEGRYVRGVREVRPGRWRGLVGRRSSRTIEVRS